jgi:diguanylate cyclase (GGDEF)-like protein
MNRTPDQIDQNNSAAAGADIRGQVSRAERREMWAWGNAVVVILGLTGGVVSLSVALLLKGTQTIFGLNLKLAVYGLVCLVVLFTAHMIYQHLHLKKIKRALAEQQIQAEVFRRLAMFDPLTGLFNRRFAEERIRTEIARSERKGLTLILVLLDLNDFKQVNDEYGHPVGDLVLKEFAKRLTQSTRAADLAVRWGGDEFMLLLVDCQITELSTVLFRLHGFAVSVEGKDVPISFCFGWKEFEPGKKMADLIECADRNLYINKASKKHTGNLKPMLVS